MTVQDIYNLADLTNTEVTLEWENCHNLVILVRGRLLDRLHFCEYIEDIKPMYVTIGCVHEPKITKEVRIDYIHDTALRRFVEKIKDKFRGWRKNICKS